jgi:site-specific recombinase XerD
MADYSDLQTQDSNELSTDFRELHSEAKEHLLNSKAKNTQRAYASDWSHFEEWCHSNSFISLPSKPQTIVYYITKLGKTKKASTIKRKMAAISQRHETKGYQSPCKTPFVKGVWEGLQRKMEGGTLAS